MWSLFTAGRGNFEVGGILFERISIGGGGIFFQSIPEEGQLVCLIVPLHSDFSLDSRESCMDVLT